jgi:hypothetical protein
MADLSNNRKIVRQIKSPKDLEKTSRRIYDVLKENPSAVPQKKHDHNTLPLQGLPLV